MKATGVFPPLPEDMLKVFHEACSNSDHPEDRDQSLKLESLRAFWITVEGNVRVSSKTGSRANLENLSVALNIVDAFCKYAIYPNLRKSMAIVTAYRRQAQLYIDAFNQRVKSGLASIDDFPQVLTVDSAQGSEFTFVIFYIVNTETHRQGFCTEHGRYCVALTRAKEAIWVVGSPMEVDIGYHHEKVVDDIFEPVRPKSILGRYREYLTRRGRDASLDQPVIHEHSTRSSSAVPTPSEGGKHQRSKAGSSFN